MTDEDEHLERAGELADRIIDLAYEGDYPPAVLMQSCLWVTAWLLKHTVPADMRRAVRSRLLEEIGDDIPERLH